LQVQNKQSFFYIKMKKIVLAPLWIVFGIFFILLGVIGIFVPIMPGPLFIIIGAIFLGIERKIIEKYIDRYFRKFKKKK